MRFWKILGKLEPKELYHLAVLCLGHPLWVWPTWRATSQTVLLANREFGDKHQLNNPANAFRHGLWNFLIAQYCSGNKRDRRIVLNWTCRITGLHEEFMPNSELEKAMDLHNNRVGRKLFIKHGPMSEEDVVALMKRHASKSRLIATAMELHQQPEEDFVHLKEFDNI